MPHSRQRRLRPLALALAAIAAGCSAGLEPGGSWEAPEAPGAVGPGAIGAEAPSFFVRDARGTVDRLRSGAWAPATAGEKLQPADVLRTEAGGAATVAVGEGAELLLEEGSQLAIGTIDRDEALVRLSRGRLAAEVAGGGASLRVEAADAIAETGQGSFSLFHDGAGGVAVAATGGEVRLRSSGGDELLEAGERAAIGEDGSLVRGPIPASVFLKVAWPEELATRATEVVVRGAVEAGTVVRINGAAVQVTGDGFEALVPLDEGRNRVEVAATDLAGRTVREEELIEVHRTPPVVRARNEGLWR